ncbi:MAG: hypothetical protein ABI120_19695 [Gemmatimonadaceae bacterium]
MNTLPPFANWLPRNPDLSQSSTRPRALILSSDFPPRTSIGAARWEGFAPFLADAGWGISVVIEDPNDVASPDWNRFNELPPDLRVASCKRTRPAWYRLFRRLRGAKPVTVGGAAAATSLDADQVGAAPSLAREAVGIAVHAQQARQLAREFAETASSMCDEHVKVVISSGPAHYVHVSAAQVSRRCRIPHIVDLRDPWTRVVTPTMIEQLLPDPEMRANEAATLRRAAMIITNTDAAKSAMQARFPELRDRIHCIPNGSDVEPVMAPAQWPSVFQIAHAGTLYLDRDPRSFLRAVARVRTKLNLDSTSMRVVFMGCPARIAGQSLSELAQEAGIGDLFEERAPGTREEARQLMRESMMAVAFQGATKTQVPAKIFEYVAFPLWLLALVGSDSATADMLAGSDALIFNIDDEDATARAIEDSYSKFRAGEMPRPAGWDGRYSRAKQAARMVAELKALTVVGG